MFSNYMYLPTIHGHATRSVLLILLQYIVLIQRQNNYLFIIIIIIIISSSSSSSSITPCARGRLNLLEMCTRIFLGVKAAGV
jgi:hypothetical protein